MSKKYSEAMNIGNARQRNGVVLGYGVLETSTRMAKACSGELQKNDIYDKIKEYLDPLKIDLYFEKLFYETILPIAKEIEKNKWLKRQNPAICLAPITIPDVPWIELLKKSWPETTLKYRYKSLLDIISELSKRSGKYLIKEKIHLLIKRHRASFWKHTNVFNAKNYSDDKIGKRKAAYIAVNYVEGIDLERRPDIFWYPNSGVKPESVLIYFDNRSMLNRYENGKNVIEKIEKMGFKWKAHFKISNKAKNNNCSPKSIYRHPKLERVRSIIVNYKARNKTSKWYRNELKILVDKILYWISFFKENDIRIHHDMTETGTDNIVKNIALDFVDGCSFGKERGLMVNGYGFFGCYPNKIFFSWGKQSAQRYLKSNNIKEYVILSGEPYGRYDKVKNESILKIKKQFNRNGVKFILLLLDNAHSANGSIDMSVHTAAMKKFYELFLKCVLIDSEFGLIIKSKKPVIQDGIPGISDMIQRCELTGRCLNVPDPFRQDPSDFAIISDIVVSASLFLPGALIKTVLRGTRGIIYDYPNLKNNETKLYKWGNKKVIFTDLDEMVTAIKEYKQNPFNNPKLGNWSGHLEDIDPYRDQCGAYRIGRYIKELQEGFENGLGCRKAINRANLQFTNKWGQDKIIHSVFSDAS